MDPSSRCDGKVKIPVGHFCGWTDHRSHRLAKVESAYPAHSTTGGECPPAGLIWENGRIVKMAVLSRKPSHLELTMGKLTDVHLEELDHEGFVIVPNFITGDKLKSLQAAHRRNVPTYEQIKDDLPLEQSGYSFMRWFPHEEMELFRATMDGESNSFARKWLKTDDIHARVGDAARQP